MQKTPDKADESTTANDKVTPEKQSAPEGDTTEIVKTNSTPVKELKKIESEFKTPEKTRRPTQSIESEAGECKTPENPPTPKDKKNDSVETNSTPLKRVKKSEPEFKTPEKSSRFNQSVESDVNGTPGKLINNFDLKLEQTTSCDGEDGMISTTEQARLLIAASKTPSKSVNKTPVKQNTPNGKRSLENSPVTPGKHRRVELITLASPKAKRIKQM